MNIRGRASWARVAQCLATVTIAASGCGDDDTGTIPDAATEMGALDAGGDVGPATPDAARSCGTSADCPTPEDPCVVSLCSASGRCERFVRDQDSDGHPDRACRPADLAPGDDCDDLDPQAFPGASERCETELDEDCDPATAGEADAAGDADGDGYVSAACCNRDVRVGDLTCGPDCDDADGAIHPGMSDGPPACDNVDNDCDGLVDTGCPCPPGACECEPDAMRPCGGGMVNDAPAVCRRGTETCGGPTGWGTCEGAVGPGGEVCNALDDDCDGMVNEEPDASASCSAPSGTVACLEGRCQVTSCPSTTADCDRDASNGCEADTATSSTHCGACGTGCSGPCVGGRCDPVVQISAGTFHVCALRTGGSVWCWGSNLVGQLGTGPTGADTGSPVPVRVEGIGPVQSISAFSAHTCAVQTGGQAVCWGDNAEGQLGNAALGVGGFSVVPVEAAGATAVTIVAAGTRHTCARTRAPSVICWGSNAFGQLGQDPALTGPATATPVTVTLPSIVQQLTAGGGHTCARVAGIGGSAGRVYCWGSPGALGDGVGGVAPHPIPVAVSGLEDAVFVSAGSSHSCAVRASGAAVCWGNNVAGALGNGMTLPSLVPADVVGLMDATSVSANSGQFGSTQHSCARRASGSAVCWGANFAGQLGDGTMVTPRPTPAAVATTVLLAEVTTGGVHTCGRTVDGAVYCWGVSAEGLVTPAMGRTVTTPEMVVF